jgi:5-(carboxyamino)imidazole ribonucleotide mutase
MADKPLIGVVMGSISDWETMSLTCQTLDILQIPYEKRILSAHRTPDETAIYAEQAEERGIEVLIAAAGGAAHLAGVLASKTLLPVIGVPMKSGLLGFDSLLSIVQMPKGVPVATVAIGSAGASNSAILAAQILARKYPEIRLKLAEYKAEQSKTVLTTQFPDQE